MTDIEKDAIEKLRNTAKQCHQSECWDIESCSDCYVEVEDIKAIDIVLNLVERLQAELEQERDNSRDYIHKYLKLIESYNRVIARLNGEKN